MEEKMKQQSSKKVLPVGTIFIFSLWVLAGVMAYSYWNSRTAVATPPAELMGVLRPAPKLLENFSLVDQSRQSFNQTSLIGNWTFLFFGFTSCPDVCPTTLSILNTIDQQLKTGSQKATNTQVVLVSVDPNRDTPEKLAEYIAYFNPEFIAATGSKAELDKFTSMTGAGYIFEEETSPGVYQVNHTSAIFLIDPQARLVASFSQPHRPDTIVEQYWQIREYFE